jgi:hypothetical protein
VYPLDVTDAERVEAMGSARCAGSLCATLRCAQRLKLPRLVAKYTQAMLSAAFRGKLTGNQDGFSRVQIGEITPA